MFGSRKGQVSPAVMLIAIGAAGLYFAVAGVVTGAKYVGHEIAKAGHAIAKPFHRVKGTK